MSPYKEKADNISRQAWLDTFEKSALSADIEAALIEAHNDGVDASAVRALKLGASDFTVQRIFALKLPTPDKEQQP